MCFGKSLKRRTGPRVEGLDRGGRQTWRHDHGAIIIGPDQPGMVFSGLKPQKT
jgi:hypothetical protein